MNATTTPRSSVSTDAHVDTAATREVLLEVLMERRNQVDRHGWTPAHDDEHAFFDFAWLIGRRAIEMCNPMTADAVDVRRMFVEMAAISVAAIESFDRKETSEAEADQTG